MHVHLQTINILKEIFGLRITYTVQPKQPRAIPYILIDGRLTLYIVIIVYRHTWLSDSSYSSFISGNDTNYRSICKNCSFQFVHCQLI